MFLIAHCNIQLGAGTAVPGIVAAKCGAHVTLSDREDIPRLFDNLKQICILNGFNTANAPQIHTVGISWGIFSPQLLGLAAQDVILASDCFYDSKGIYIDM